MSQKITNQEVLNVLDALSRFKFAEATPIAFAYWKAEVTRKLETIRKDLIKAMEPDEKFKKMAEEKKEDIIELKKKFADKDEKDKPLFVAGTKEYLISDENAESFFSAVKELEEGKYNELSDEEDRTNKEVAEVLEQNAKISITKFKMKDLEGKTLQDTGNVDAVFNFLISK